MEIGYRVSRQGLGRVWPWFLTLRLTTLRYSLVPPVSRMASEIGDKDYGGLFGCARHCGYDAPAPHKTLALKDDGEHVLVAFFLYPLPPSLYSSPSVSIVNFYHFPSPNISQP